MFSRAGSSRGKKGEEIVNTRTAYSSRMSSKSSNRPAVSSDCLAPKNNANNLATPLLAGKRPGREGPPYREKDQLVDSYSNCSQGLSGVAAASSVDGGMRALRAPGNQTLSCFLRPKARFNSNQAWIKNAPRSERNDRECAIWLLENCRDEDVPLRGLKLTSLPENIGQFQEMTELDISWNRLTSLPDSIVELKNLKKLDLRYNRTLRSLPREIGKLQNLEELYIDNPLESLPESIGDLKNLEVLYLFGFKLPSLPIKSFEKLKKLEELALTPDPSLPQKIAHLERRDDPYFSAAAIYKWTSPMVSFPARNDAVKMQANIIKKKPNRSGPAGDSKLLFESAPSIKFARDNSRREIIRGGNILSKRR